MYNQNIFKRYELKFLITKEQQGLLKAAMLPYMKGDTYQNTTINSIYFDTPDMRLIRRSLEKPIYKEKLRLRSYGVATKEKDIFIEIKKKYQGVVYKRRTEAKEEDAMNYLCCGTPLPRETQITKEINYLCSYYETLTPAVFLSYRREAYVGKEDSDFRITFDQNILYRDYDLSLTKGIYGKDLIPQEYILLEVKTILGIPLWLAKFCSENAIIKTSFSKYGTAYTDMEKTKRRGGPIHVA